MSKSTILGSPIRRLAAVAVMLGAPIGGAALVSSPAGASTITFTGFGSVGNPCTSTTETFSGPTIITLRSSGSTTLVSYVWEGKTSGGDTFVVSGKATVPTSSNSYVIPIRETFTGPTGTYRGPGSVTIYHSGSQPTGDSASFSTLTCLTP